MCYCVYLVVSVGTDLEVCNKADTDATDKCFVFMSHKASHLYMACLA